MRTPKFAKQKRGEQISSQYSVPAPVGGWNRRDSIADMAEDDANIMTNWFPETTDVRIRKGIIDHVTGIGQQVESLMTYNASDGTQTLFGAANDSFYNVTSAGAVGGAVVGSLTNARWQHLNFTNSSGTSYLCTFNGTDSPNYWNGSAWITVTGVSTPAITGLTTSTIISGAIHNRRLWLVAVNSLKAWYLPPDSVGGLAKSFDLSGIASKGGYLMAMETWTLDAGDGIDDMLVVYTSEGQVIVMQGTDPVSTSTWKVIGTWNIGEPIGRRCMIKYRGDVLLLCQDGVFPLSKILIGAQTEPEEAVTWKINQAMAEVSNDHRSKYGWEIVHYPRGHQLFLNIPIKEGSEQEQYVMNTITGAWGRFTGIEANCWGLINRQLYFGTNGEVVKFGRELGDDGDIFADNSTNIDGDLQTAFSYFKDRGRLKQFKSMRANFLLSGEISSLFGINVDFDDAALGGSISFSPAAGNLWDAATALWDTALWSSGVSPSGDWLTVTAVGTAAAARLQTASQSDVRLQSFDHLYESGGVIA